MDVPGTEPSTCMDSICSKIKAAAEIRWLLQNLPSTLVQLGVQDDKAGNEAKGKHLLRKPMASEIEYKCIWCSPQKKLN